MTTTAHSTDGGPIPFGLGFHPYLRAGLEEIDEAILQLPAHHTVDLDGRGVPTGGLTAVRGNGSGLHGRTRRRGHGARYRLHDP